MRTWKVCCAIGVAVLVGAIWAATTAPVVAQAPCPPGKPSTPSPGPLFVPTANCEGWIPANHPDAPGQPTNTPERQRIAKGFEIAPVPLNLSGLDRDLVGLGSYIVNGQADCNGCHNTPPEYVEGGDPALGQPTIINQAGYLGGGADLFGPFVPRNLTPDAAGRPAGLTLDQFLEVFTIGTDFKRLPPPVPSPQNDLLQVMPWPIFRHMLQSDKRAIYEYLRAIPRIIR